MTEIEKENLAEEISVIFQCMFDNIGCIPDFYELNDEDKQDVMMRACRKTYQAFRKTIKARG